MEAEKCAVAMSWCGSCDDRTAHHVTPADDGFMWTCMADGTVRVDSGARPHREFNPHRKMPFWTRRVLDPVFTLRTEEERRTAVNLRFAKMGMAMHSFAVAMGGAGIAVIPALDKPDTAGLWMMCSGLVFAALVGLSESARQYWKHRKPGLDSVRYSEMRYHRVPRREARKLAREGRTGCLVLS